MSLTKKIETVLVIPCFNEASRFPKAQFQDLVQALPEGFVILFVNDGSVDHTSEVLKTIVSENSEKVFLLDLNPNQGKAEAVRQGVLWARKLSPSFIGYADADLATPPTEILRVFNYLKERSELKVVLATRILYLGTLIKRKYYRHYSGRVFATFASEILRIPVYDTQCGCKFFKSESFLYSAMSKPFLSRWAFDVELIGRILENPDSESRILLNQIHEVPLKVWTDVSGSTLNFLQMIRAFFDLFRIYLDLRKRRRHVTHPSYYERF